jgi:DNA-binding MarR family transcriptional regulator
MHDDKCFHHMKGKYTFHEFNRRMQEMIKDMSNVDDLSGFEINSRIRILANVFDSLMHQRENEKAISGPRVGILMRLMMDEEMEFGSSLTPTILSRLQGVSKNTVSSLIRGLEDQGLVTREIDQTDKRIFRLRITERGRQLVKEDVPQIAQYLNTITSGLTAEEKVQLIALLDKLRTNLLTYMHDSRKASFGKPRDRK